MWKVSWFYEKVHNIANFGGYAAILFLIKQFIAGKPVHTYLKSGAGQT